MAQADPTVASQLRSAILNICSLPRGCRTFSDMFAEGIKNVPNNDVKDITKMVTSVMDEHVFNSASNYFDNEPPFQLEKVIFSGSFSEGTLKINMKTGVLSDTDFMLILKNIKVTEEDQRQGNLTLKENSAFVNLYVTKEALIKTWAEFLETSCEDQSGKNTMLSSMKLKERLRKKYAEYGPMITLLNNEDVKEADDGPSIEVISSIPGTENFTSHQHTPFPISQFDFVLAIKCDGWPLCAQEWLTRIRRWPTHDVVRNIVQQGFHIVCKSSSEGSFRLSFSNAEALLIKNLTDLQHKTYRGFKSFISNYKNKLNPQIKNILCSYYIKTIFLWYCEKYDPKDWNEDTVVRHLLSLTDELVMALKERSLPMYFMPKYNLMDKMEDGTKVAEKIEELRFNPQLISEAIIAEEPTLIDLVNFIFTRALPECNEVLQKGLVRGKFETTDFLESIKTMDKRLNDSWMSAVGRLPTQNDELVKKAFETLVGPCMKHLNTLFKSLK